MVAGPTKNNQFNQTNMKIKAFLLAALAASLIPLAVDAKPGKGKKRPPSPERIIAHLDEDENGAVSYDEAVAADAQRLLESFSDIDTNGDNSVSLDELTAHIDAKRAERGERCGDGECNKDGEEI